MGSVSRNMTFFLSLLQVDVDGGLPAEEVVMGRAAEEVAGGLQRAEDEGSCHPPGP